MSNGVDPEKITHVASQLYEMRRLTRSLMGDKYAEKMKPYQDLIQKTEQDLKCDTLIAATKLGQLVKGDGFEVIFIMAAAVERIEALDAEKRRSDPSACL